MPFVNADLESSFIDFSDTPVISGAIWSRIGVNGITVYQVVGCGAQRGITDYVRGQKIDVQVLAKIKFEIVVSSEEWEEKTIEAIKKAEFTGNLGDGKIFSYDIRKAVKIRTGETGYDAVQSLTE